MEKKKKLSKTDKRLKTLAVKTKKQKEAFLKQIRQYPIIETACKRADIGRSTYYHWFKNDSQFRKLAEMALDQGRGFANDMAESMLLKNVQNGNNTAIIFWLKNNHKGYNDRIVHDHRYSISMNDNNDKKGLFTPEETAAMLKAFNNAGFAGVIKQNSHGDPAIDIEALEKGIPEAEKLTAPHIAEQEQGSKEHRRRYDMELHGLSEEEHEANEIALAEKKAAEKKAEKEHLKSYFKKYHKEKRRREKEQE